MGCTTAEGTLTRHERRADSWKGARNFVDDRAYICILHGMVFVQEAYAWLRTMSGAGFKLTISIPLSISPCILLLYLGHKPTALMQPVCYATF